MALLFFDGFDHVGHETMPVPKWGDVYYWRTNTSFPRTGAGCLTNYLSGSSYYAKTRPRITNGGIVVGAAFYITNYGAAGGPAFLLVMEGSTYHLNLSLTPLGFLELRRGTTVLATGQIPITPNSWFFLELKGIIHATAGSYEVHVDGTVDPGLVATGVNTQNGGTGVWDHAHLTSPTGNTYVDDFYLCDTSGAAPYNTFLGPVRIETLFPQTDAVAAGSNAGLVPSIGTDHGAMVDDNPPNTTDFNSSALLGVKDTYNYPPMVNTGTIYAIQPNLYVAKSDSSARQICSVVRMGGVDYDGVPSSLSVTWGYVSQMWMVNPNTLANWTPADIAAVQAGMKIVG